jgi:hypothetical protein
VNQPGGVLESESTVYAACAAALAIGLAFIFVRAPHPWGVEGFDHYHELALAVASGRPFPTMDVPWGYAYFLAAFYRLFGDHPAIPLTVQALLNAWVPLLVYRLALHWVERRTAVLAAVLSGLFSFNTVYASTQSSDAVCTVIVLAATLAFVRAAAAGRLRLYALAGALFGLASQFRPNLILVPLLLAGYAIAVDSRGPRRLAPAAALLASATLALTPWIVRNYRLTRMFIPASVHGGVQLWYGTLQVGPYLHSRAYNPRSAFESGVFDYTSLVDVPLVVTVRPFCAQEPPARVTLEYWTHRDPVHRTIDAVTEASIFRIELPPPAAPDAIYHVVTATLGDGSVESVPPDRLAQVYFVSRDHLGDMDVGGDLLDIFDLVRMMRHRAWNEPLQWSDKLAAAGFHGDDLEGVVVALAKRFGESAQEAAPAVTDFRSDDRSATMTLADGSTIAVPRGWRGRITDVDVSGGLAAALMPSTVQWQRVRESGTRPMVSNACIDADSIGINTDFYRAEPQRNARYTALALDNIAREPAEFALATLFRIGRLFVVWGSRDAATMQQFRSGRIVTGLATVASIAFVALFLSGGVLTWRRGDPVGLPLLLVVYVPATIAPMLTNMRYTVTVQPIMFVFVAAALIWPLARAQAAPPAPPARVP